MITMPDARRTVERSAAILRRHGISRHDAYLIVAEISLEVTCDLIIKGATEYRWLFELKRIATERAASSPAAEKAPDR